MDAGGRRGSGRESRLGRSTAVAGCGGDGSSGSEAAKKNQVLFFFFFYLGFDQTVR